MVLKLPERERLLSEPKYKKLAVIIGAALILLISASALLPESKSAPQPTENTAETERRLEQRLEALLSQIEGVSSPNVMVTLESTSEHVYARDSKSGESASHNDGGGSNANDAESTVVIIGSGSEKEALEQSLILPKVRGVAVVCEGAQSPEIKERVVNTVAAALCISTARVYVTY